MTLFKSADPIVDATLAFNGHEYDLSRVLDLAATGPLVELSAEEINLDVAAQYLAVPASSIDELLHGQPIFFKFEGRYIVLRGTAKLKELLSTAVNDDGRRFQGRLLSSPALKKARLFDATALEAAPAEQEHAPHRYNDDHARDDYRAPRTYGQRTPTTSGDQMRARSPYRNPTRA